MRLFGSFKGKIKQTRRELVLLEKQKEVFVIGREQFRQLMKKNLAVPVAVH